MISSFLSLFSTDSKKDEPAQYELRAAGLPRMPTPGLIEVEPHAFKVSAPKMAMDLGFRYNDNPGLWNQIAEIWNDKMLLRPELSLPPICRALSPILKSPEDWRECSLLLYGTLHEGPLPVRVYGNGSLQFLSEAVPALVSGRSVINLVQLKEKVPALVAVVNPLSEGEHIYLRAARVLRERAFTTDQIRTKLRKEMESFLRVGRDS